MDTSRIYYLGKRNTVYGLAAASFLGGISMVLLDILFSHEYTGESGAWIWFSGFLILMGPIFFHWALTARLIITPQGLECYDTSTFMAVYVHWQQVSEILKYQNRIFILLNSPGKPTSRFYHWLELLKLTAPCLIVDLTDFIDHWNEKELIEDFRNHLPEVQVKFLK